MAKSMKDDRGAAERAMLYAREIDNDNHIGSHKRKELDAIKAPESSAQIVKLLQQVRNRLADIERERNEMWESIQEQNKTLTELEDRSTSTEKSYISIENRMSRNEMSDAPVIERLDELERAQKESAGKEANEELRKDIINRLEESDLQTARLIERIDEAMAMQTRMNRRIDKVVQDKQRLNRKLSLLEESVDMTRQALTAKAMVLLTDKTLVAQSETPSIPLYPDTSSDEDIFDEKQALRNALPKEDDPIFTASKPAPRDNSFRNQAIAASLFVIVAATAGWFISKNINSLQQDTAFSEYQVERYSPPEQQQDVPRFETSVMADMPAKEPSGINVIAQSQTPTYAYGTEPSAQVAAQLNAIEPVAGTDVEPEKPAQPSEAEEQAAAASALVPEAVIAASPAIFEADETLPEAFKKIEIDAFKGNAEAQHDLAVIYTAGRAGVPQNFERAAYWFTKASNQGIANARYNLGVLYHQGLGVEQDIAQAINWYQKAAQLGHGEAQYNLGIAHIEGIGVDYNPAQAAEYFEAAAATGVPEAAFNLGLIYENGLTGAAQPDEAILWYKTAADLGNADARNAMEQLAKNLNIKIEDIDSLVEKIKTPQPDKQSQLTETQPVQKTATPNPLAEVSTDNVTRQIQEQLISFGLFPGPADGYTGPLTEDAIRLYQARHDIPVTGEASEELLVHMLTKNLRNSAFIELGSGE